MKRNFLEKEDRYKNLASIGEMHTKLEELQKQMAWTLVSTLQTSIPCGFFETGVLQYIVLNDYECEINISGVWKGKRDGAIEGEAAVRQAFNREIWWKGGRMEGMMKWRFFKL